MQKNRKYEECEQQLHQNNALTTSFKTIRGAPQRVVHVINTDRIQGAGIRLKNYTFIICYIVTDLVAGRDQLS